MKPYIYCIVGRAGAGKTRFLEDLIPYLLVSGLKISTYKSSRRALVLDYPASDADRLSRSGAVRTVLHTSCGLITFHGENPSDTEALEIAGQDTDILFIEGRIETDCPVIEVVRAGLPIFSPEQVWLSVTLRPTGLCLEVPDAAAAAEQILTHVGNKSLESVSFK